MVMMNCRLLVAEDNEINQKLIRVILDKNGFTYQLVQNGEEALSLFKQNSFDIILMDCQMPKMDGFTATHHVREYEQKHGLKRIPIIALTANAMKGDKEKCLSAGMDDFLPKPFQMQQILQLINTWMPHKKEN